MRNSVELFNRKLNLNVITFTNNNYFDLNFIEIHNCLMAYYIICNFYSFFFLLGYHIFFQLLKIRFLPIKPNIV